MNFVLVTKASDLWGGEQAPQGVVPCDDSWLKTCSTFFVERDHAEEDLGFKQVIPYVVVYDAGDPTKVLTYRRKGSEGRLTGLRSIGFGGHVEPCDASRRLVRWHAVREAAYRELREELGVRTLVGLREVGKLINDDSNDVGRVHLGVVMTLPVNPNAVSFNEDEGHEWVDVADLRGQVVLGMHDLETWSRMLVESGVV